MLSMNADRTVFSLALCLMFVSSNGAQYCNGSCETQTLSAPLGSSVFLQCSFPSAIHSSLSTLNWVSWMQIPDSSLVSLTSNGYIRFADPRHGRVKAFPNQGSEGNYSICIDELQQSDLGCYRCEQGDDCFQVEIVPIKAAMSEEMKLLVYICIGVATFILLVTAFSYCCVKCASLCCKGAQDYVNNPDNAGVSAQPEEPCREARDEQERGAGDNQFVYENEDHDPANRQDDLYRNQQDLPGVLRYLDRNEPTQSASEADPNTNQHNFDRTESHRRKLRLHRELISRLRPASLSQHYYINQAELSHQAMASHVENHHRVNFGRKKAKQKSEYKNPIYNKSPDRIHQL